MIENKIPGISHFTKTTKMADILHVNYHLLVVLNRLGIKLGFGDKTIENVCCDYKLDVDFVLLIINSFHKPESLNIKNQDIDSVLLVKYLLQTHDYYTKVVLPALKHMISDLVSKTEDLTKSALLNRFFKKYLVEFNEHVEYEEKIAFPYIFMLSEVYQNGVDKKEISDINYRFSNFVENHTNIEDKLFDLKNMLIKYCSVPDDESIIHILFILFRFENDLRNHALLENELLVSLVEKMEKAVFDS